MTPIEIPQSKQFYCHLNRFRKYTFVNQYREQSIRQILLLLFFFVT